MTLSPHNSRYHTLCASDTLHSSGSDDSGRKPADSKLQQCRFSPKFFGPLTSCINKSFEAADFHFLALICVHSELRTISSRSRWKSQTRNRIARLRPRAISILIAVSRGLMLPKDEQVGTRKILLAFTFLFHLPAICLFLTRLH
jgi:hypothetical protein